ncbi:MAG: hypothetical protein KGS45_07115 [Planctomycetes bacterium]|nr:hypothetical protein [Planctomycetota bacterium]
MKLYSAAIVTALGLAASANAAFYLESESNDTQATANFIGSYIAPGDGIVVDGGINSVQAPDEDWFTFTTSNVTQIVVSVFGRPNSNVGDSYLELYDSAGTLLAFDDDSNVGLFSSLEYTTASGGSWSLKVRKFSPQGVDFNYKMIIGLNITPVPTPGAATLMAVGGLLVARRRRA